MLKQWPWVRTCCVMTVGMVAVWGGTVAHTSAAEVDLDQAIKMEDDCLEQLSNRKTAEISCAFPALMDPKDRAAIKKMTNDSFENAQCMITVKLDSAIVDKAVAAVDGEVVVPPQQVACKLETNQGDLPVDFTFAPKVMFKAGVAVKANPGMGNVKGVSTWLSWPVVAYLNTNKSIQTVMVRVVNAFVKRERQKQATAQ
jgi:hypothetical protein